MEITVCLQYLQEMYEKVCAGEALAVEYNALVDQANEEHGIEVFYLGEEKGEAD